MYLGCYFQPLIIILAAGLSACLQHLRFVFFFYIYYLLSNIMFSFSTSSNFVLYVRGTLEIAHSSFCEQ